MKLDDAADARRDISEIALARTKRHSSVEISLNASSTENARNVAKAKPKQKVKRKYNRNDNGKTDKHGKPKRMK